MVNHGETSGPGFAKGKVDPREAGRAGGIASGNARRQRPLRELEARVLEGGNAFAAYRLRRDLHEERRRQEPAQAPGAVAAIDYHAVLVNLLRQMDALRRARGAAHEVGYEVEVLR
jgi:hypothetical protein